MKLYKKIKIIFLLYSIISTILLLCFWYYVSIFCAVYKNTQIHLIKDIMMSFGTSLVYPFGIYLLPGICRIPTLSKKGNKKECLYKFSKLFLMI